MLIGPGVLSERVSALLDQVNQAYLKITFNRDWDKAGERVLLPANRRRPVPRTRHPDVGFTTGIHGRYHLPSDEAKALDPAKMESIARTVFVSVWALADAAERPRIDKTIPQTVPRYR